MRCRRASTRDKGIMVLQEVVILCKQAYACSALVGPPALTRKQHPWGMASSNCQGTQHGITRLVNIQDTEM
jgi:hypothetical protein